MIDTLQALLRTRLDDDAVAVLSRERTWTWREHLAEAAAEASAVIAIADPNRSLHVGALLTNSPAYTRSMAAAALGGHVLCGINTTRRGQGLLSDIRRSDCRVLLVDADHAPLLDGLDLSGITVLDVTGPA
ncbi:MAG TPA: acyl-CoA synthetase, partial [Mycobacterium sp.]|nr:acyl-CoA synthetase [Mycobacterium sp.]